MSLFRRTMMRPKGSAPAPSVSYNFKFKANFQANADKNALSMTVSPSSSAISTWGIGFGFYTTLNGFTTSQLQYKVSGIDAISETENNCTITIKVTNPNNQTQTTTMQNALTGAEAGQIMGYGYSLAKNIIITYDSSASSQIEFTQSNSVVAATTNSKGTTNYGTGSNNDISLIMVGTSSSNLDITMAHGCYSCKSNLTNGDYIFDITIDLVGVDTSAIYVANYGAVARTQDGKANYDAWCTNRSKVQWISGDSVFIDNMYKANGSI